MSAPSPPDPAAGLASDTLATGALSVEPSVGGLVSGAAVSAAGPAEAGPELDLAFSLEPGPGESPPALTALRQRAGPLADPELAPEQWQALVAAWLASLLPELPPDLRSPAYSLGLSLVDDSAIAALNSAWRQRSGPTDVLAFAAQEEAPPLPSDPALAEPLELGDIVISLETAAVQAAAAGHSLDEELRFLASHGLLHLLGWDHPDEASLAAMLARQQQLLELTGD